MASPVADEDAIRTGPGRHPGSRRWRERSLSDDEDTAPAGPHGGRVGLIGSPSFGSRRSSVAGADTPRLTIIKRFPLTGESASAVEQLFSTPPGATSSVTLFSAFLLLYSGVTFARRMQRIYRAAWGQEKAGVRSTVLEIQGWRITNPGSESITANTAAQGINIGEADDNSMELPIHWQAIASAVRNRAFGLRSRRSWRACNWGRVQVAFLTCQTSGGHSPDRIPQTGNDLEDHHRFQRATRRCSPRARRHVQRHLDRRFQ